MRIQDDREIEDHEEEEEDRLVKKRRKRIGIVVLTIVLAFGSVVMGITVRNMKTNLKTNNNTTETGVTNETAATTAPAVTTDAPSTKTPTMNPTTPPSTAQPTVPPALRHNTTAEIQEDLLLALQYNESSYLLGDSYPEDSYMGKALKWMLEEDSQFHPVNQTSPIVLLERFLLASIFYAFDGPTWRNPYWKYEWESEYYTRNFLRPEYSVCEWNGWDNYHMNDQGVFCDDETTTTTSRVTAIQLSYGEAVGSLPPEIVFLPNLQRIDFSRNRIVGPLPTEIGTMSSLTSLTLDKGQISGTLPTELGNLSNLRIFNIGSNLLTGTLPTELGKLDNLEMLELQRNQLTGTVPNEVCALRNSLSLESLIVDCAPNPDTNLPEIECPVQDCCTCESS